jgi:hypothetical protein
MAWTRRRAAAAYASVSSTFLTMASSRVRRAATSVSSGMVTARGREPMAAADEQYSGSNYHVSGEGLSRN